VHGQVDLQGNTDASKDAHRRERVSPQIEEVLVDADLVEAEHLGKRVRYGELRRRSRRAAGCARRAGRQRGCRECRPVDLAVRRQRDTVDGLEQRWNHRTGKMPVDDTPDEFRSAMTAQVEQLRALLPTAGTAVPR